MHQPSRPGWTPIHFAIPGGNDDERPPQARPGDIPHTFIVSADEARSLLVTEPAGLEEFVRAVAEPAQRLEIPPPATEPPDVERLAEVAATFGVEIIGPPGIPD